MTDQIQIRTASEVVQGSISSVEAVGIDAKSYVQLYVLSGSTQHLVDLLDEYRARHRARKGDKPAQRLVSEAFHTFKRRFWNHADAEGLRFRWPGIESTNGEIEVQTKESAAEKAKAKKQADKDEAAEGERQFQRRQQERQLARERGQTTGDLYASAVKAEKISPNVDLADLAALLIAGLSDNQRDRFASHLKALTPAPKRRKATKTATAKTATAKTATANANA